MFGIPAIVFATVTAVASPEPKPVLPFVDDDYAAALTTARAKNIPIFAEAWAPWCHTCRSMRAFVFTDKALAGDAGRFVWLSINTEKAANAEFLKKYPVNVWPSFYAINPSTEKIALRWVGGASVAQLKKILADAERAVQPAGSNLARELARADTLYGEGKNKEAAAAYRKAIAIAPKDWPSYRRTVESLLFALSDSDDPATSLDVARAAMPQLRHTTSAATVASSGLEAALALPDTAPDKKRSCEEFEKVAREVVDDKTLALAGDDRSGLYQDLIEARKSAGDKDGERRVTAEWSAFLDGEAARAKTPEERQVYDSHRVSAYIAVGAPEKAVPMLEESQKDSPDDYNPPARLALAYKAMKQYEKALEASDRALALGYGPRKIGILLTRADIYKEKGDDASARKTMEEALRYAEGLPEGQRSDRQIAALKKKLDASAPAAN
jgi:tetratricopeptide (TPR) repeat protein